MAYALRFDGVNDYITLASAMSGSAGTSTYSFRVKSGPSGITLPPTGYRAFIGRSDGTVGGAAGFFVTSEGTLRVYTGGIDRYGSTSQLVFSGVEFDYTLTHLSSGGWDIYDNLTNLPTGQSGTFTLNTSFGSLGFFGRASNGGTTYFQGDIALIAVTGLTNAQTWDASLSGGTGTTLPTVSGTNQGTLVNFTVPDCWIFYDDGGAVTSTIATTWPQLSIAANQTATIPATDSVIAFTWPQLSVSAAQSAIAPVSASAAFNWPQLSVSANQSSTVPQFDSDAAFTWPQLAVSAEQSTAYSGNVINFTWPQLSVLANQSATAPDLDTAVIFTWPQLSVAVNQVTPVENPEYNFPISSYGNNNQWRFSPFFKQTK